MIAEIWARSPVWFEALRIIYLIVFNKLFGLYINSIFARNRVPAGDNIAAQTDKNVTALTLACASVSGPKNGAGSGPANPPSRRALRRDRRGNNGTIRARNSPLPNVIRRGS